MPEAVSFKIKRYLLMTIDPVHVGTGGSRLGRVDNAIIREPGTQLPKIPGTSLSGALRQYAAYRVGTPGCAGQGKNHHKANSETCPVCYTFGVANDGGANGGGSSGFSGMVSICDARLLLFPVATMQGPVWVTSPETLHDAGMTWTGGNPEGDRALFGPAITGEHLNLRWMMVARGGALSGIDVRVPELVRSRMALVSEKLFSQVVNSGLEVRTSVSIDPDTGAAQDGALFTYEALPRAVYLWADVVQDWYRKDPFPENVPGWKSPLEVVEGGLAWMAHLGVGGMGTRGFGRLRMEQSWEVQ